MIHGSNAMLGMAAQPTALDIEMGLAVIDCFRSW